MVSAICKAKNPATCPYHGAVLRMNRAALADPPDFNAYFEARNEVEKHEKAGWDETKYLEEIAKKHTPTPTPDTHEIVVNGKLPENVTVKLPYMENPLNFRLHNPRNPQTQPKQPPYVRIQTNQKLTKEQIAHLGSLFRYAYRTKIGGERLGEPYQDSPTSFVLEGNPSSSTKKNLEEAFLELEKTYPELLKTGTPIRNTDRSGPNTKGTRSIEPYPDTIKIAYYYPDTNNE